MNFFWLVALNYIWPILYYPTCHRIFFFSMRWTAAELTCSRWKVEDKYSQNTSEDAGDDNVDDVEERLPLDDEVEGDVFVQLLLDVLPAGFVTNGPLSILCEGCVVNSTGVTFSFWTSHVNSQMQKRPKVRKITVHVCWRRVYCRHTPVKALSSMTISWISLPSSSRKYCRSTSEAS